MNGVSKKLTITGISVAAVVSLAGSDPATSKLGYCIVIGVICLACLVQQTILDYKSK